MKREDVKNKITGITEEQPNWLMQENGSDITREKFLSTLSLRRATTCYCSGSLICNFYPRSPCGERHLCPGAACSNKLISIHALLAESDAPVGIADGTIQSDFYPRSPCGERRWAPTAPWRTYAISIHALLAESDMTRWHQLGWPAIFLSTLSLRRATLPDH